MQFLIVAFSLGKMNLAYFLGIFFIFRFHIRFSVKREHYLLTDEYLDAVRQKLLQLWTPPA